MEEEKSIYNQKDKIKDARSESRQQFTKIKTVDPRDRLRELPLKQAKDRRQSIFEENRSKKKEENKKMQIENKNPLQLKDMLKEITQALNTFMESTNKEIENIKRIIELNTRGFMEENEKFKKFKDETKTQIQNIIITQKELNQKWDAIGSLVEGMIEGSTYAEPMKKNLQYSKYKEDNRKLNSSYYEKIKQKNNPNVSKAILYDKYNYNKARVVTKYNDTIKTYKVSISYRYSKSMLMISILT